VTDPKDVETFFKANVKRIPYIHLKTSTKEHKVPPVMEENELPFATVFEELSKNNVVYVALEIPQQATFEECVASHQKSVEFLTKNY